MDTASNQRSYFEAKRQESGNTDPQVQQIVQLLTALVRGQNAANGREDMSNSTLAGIVSVVGSVLARQFGGNPNFASQRFDTFYSAFRDHGPMQMYGKANATGATTYYGAVNGPGNVTTNMADSLTKQINDYSNRGVHGVTGAAQRTMMTELIAARIRKHGMNSTLVDWGKNGTTAELQRAYSLNMDAIGRPGTAQGDEMIKVIKARRLMNRKAYDLMKEKGYGAALGEFDSKREYWATKEFQGAGMAEERKKLEAEILEKGIKNEITGEKIGKKAAGMAVRQSHGGFASNIADADAVAGMADELRPAMEALVKMQKQTGKTFGELNGFAAQLHMGSLTSAKGMRTMQAFMGRMEQIAAGTGRNVSEVVAEAQNIADQMGPLASSARVAKVQQRIAQAVTDQNADGEQTVYGVNAVAQMAIQQDNVGMQKSRGAAVARYALENGDLTAAQKSKMQRLLDNVEGATSDKKREHATMDVMRYAKKLGIDTKDNAFMNNLMRNYVTEGDLDKSSELDVQRNARAFAGGKGAAMTSAVFGNKSKTSKVKMARLLDTLHNAIGVDESGDKLRALREAANNMAGLSGADRDAKLKQLQEDGVYSADEVAAINALSGMSDSQFGALSRGYKRFERQPTQLTATSRTVKEKARTAASDAAMSKRIDESIVGEEQQVGALDAFMNGAFGDANLTEYDSTRGLMAQAEAHRAELLAGAKNDEERNKYKNMSISELLNLANKGVGIGGFDESNIKQFKGALADGKLTDSFKETLAGDEALMDKVGGKEKFAGMKDEEILRAYEELHGGNIHFDVNTGEATFFSREAADKGNAIGKALRKTDIGKAVISGYGNAATAAENAKFDHAGRLTNINVVTDMQERSLERKDGKLVARDGGGKNGKGGQVGAVLTKRAVDLNDLFSKYGSKESWSSSGRKEVLRRLGLTGDEAGKDKSIESFFQTDENGNYTGLSAEGAKFLSKRAAKYDEDHAKGMVPPELLAAVTTAADNLQGMNDKIGSLNINEDGLLTRRK